MLLYISACAMFGDDTMQSVQQSVILSVLRAISERGDRASTRSATNPPSRGPGRHQLHIKWRANISEEVL